MIVECIAVTALGGCVGKLMHMAWVKATVARCDRGIAANNAEARRVENLLRKLRER